MITPVIPGRTQTARLLQDAISGWSAGRGRVVLVTGEPGMGKSHLLDAIQSTAKADAALSNAPFIRVDCSPPIGKVNVAQIQPLQPFGKAIEKLYLEGEQAAKKRLAMNIGMSLLASLPIAGDIFYAVKAISQDVSEYKRETAAMQHKKRAAVTECIETLEAISRQTPFVLLIDDAQWSDPQSVEVFRQLLSRIADMPLLLIATVTPSVAQRTNLPLAALLRDPVAKDHVHALTAIDRAQADEVVGAVEPTAKPTEQQSATLFQRSAGTPGILVEYLKYLRHTEQIRTDGTIVAEALEQSGLKLGDHPATDVLLHEIADDDAMVLALCATEGQEFTAFMLAALMNTDLLSTIRTLRRLQHETGLIRSIGMRTRYGVKTTTYEFTQTVAYTYFLHYPEYEERKHLHQRIAEILTREHDASTLDEIRHQLAVYIAAHSLESEDNTTAERMLNESASAARAIGAAETADLIQSDYLNAFAAPSAIMLGSETPSSEGQGAGQGTASVADTIRLAADAIVRGQASAAYDLTISALSASALTTHERCLLLCLTARADVERGAFVDALARLDQADALPDLGTKDRCTILNVRAAAALRSGDSAHARSILHEAAQLASRLSGTARILTLGNILLLQRSAGESVSEHYQRILQRTLDDRSWAGLKEDLLKSSE